MMIIVYDFDFGWKINVLMLSILSPKHLIDRRIFQFVFCQFYTEKHYFSSTRLFLSSFRLCILRIASVMFNVFQSSDWAFYKSEFSAFDFHWIVCWMIKINIDINLSFNELFHSFDFEMRKYFFKKELKNILNKFELQIYSKYSKFSFSLRHIVVVSMMSNIKD